MPALRSWRRGRAALAAALEAGAGAALDAVDSRASTAVWHVHRIVLTREMNILFLIAPAFVLYWLAHRFYGRYLGRAFGEDDARSTPAVRHNDGVDFVPTRPHVLFAHHFCAIAAAGPILGPTWALLYGYVPTLIWIVLGAIFIGAVHDFACLFVSMREGGRSIADVARGLLGKPVFILFALYIAFNLVVVNAVFINLTAGALVATRTPAELGLDAGQSIFRTVTDASGQPRAIVGGVASTSAIVLTLVAPLLGFVIVRRLLRERALYPIATVLCVGSVLVGFGLPVAPPALDLGFVTIEPVYFWIICISIYVWVAAAAPVWLILQPREFVSVQFLYLGILLLAAALLACGLKGVPISAPASNLVQGQNALGALWPTLFITIACGSISGFHGLVASGTTCKQISRETHAKHIGYGAMLGESALALCVALAVAVGVGFADYTALLIRPADAPASWQAQPVLAFSLGVAGVCELGLGIPRWLGVVFGLLIVEGFVLDTLDVSIRLNRYLLEEVWRSVFERVPAFLTNFWVNSGIAVLLMLLLSINNTAQNLWPIFGAGNQLLGSISLLTLSIWFLTHRRQALFVLLPAIAVGITTIASLGYLLMQRYLPQKNYLLAATAIIFLLLATAVIGAAIHRLRGLRADSSA